LGVIICARYNDEKQANLGGDLANSELELLGYIRGFVDGIDGIDGASSDQCRSVPA
jgi:hypothetical protein